MVGDITIWQPARWIPPATTLNFTCLSQTVRHHQINPCPAHAQELTVVKYAVSLRENHIFPVPVGPAGPGTGGGLTL